MDRCIEYNIVLSTKLDNESYQHFCLSFPIVLNFAFVCEKPNKLPQEIFYLITGWFLRCKYDFMNC